MGRPGVMLYFDMLEPIRELSDADRGKLLIGILEYAMDGKEPNFTGMLKLTWGFVRPKIDRDGETYDTVLKNRRYAGFCSQRSKNNLPKLSREEWEELDEKGYQHLLTDVNICQPTTATTTATKSNTNTSTSTSPNTAAQRYGIPSAADRKLQRLHREMDLGAVELTQEEIDKLLKYMDITMLIEYVMRLSQDIVADRFHGSTHFNQILYWWSTEHQIPEGIA